MQNTFNNDYSKLNFVTIENQENSKATLKEYGGSKAKVKRVRKEKKLEDTTQKLLMKKLKKIKRNT